MYSTDNGARTRAPNPICHMYVILRDHIYTYIKRSSRAAVARFFANGVRATLYDIRDVFLCAALSFKVFVATRGGPLVDAAYIEYARCVISAQAIDVFIAAKWTCVGTSAPDGMEDMRRMRPRARARGPDLGRTSGACEDLQNCLVFATVVYMMRGLAYVGG